jgi:hypothetical protein
MDNSIIYPFFDNNSLQIYVESSTQSQPSVIKKSNG